MFDISFSVVFLEGGGGGVKFSQLTFILSFEDVKLLYINIYI